MPPFFCLKLLSDVCEDELEEFAGEMADRDLAWDLAFRLCGPAGDYEYVGIKPFAVGTHWVSNILHHYCLHFRRRLR